MVTNFTGTDIDNPYANTAGPDRALWFTTLFGSSIGRITTSGMVSSFTGSGISGPNGVTAGPDGALWFSNAYNSSIGRTTSTPYLGITPATGPAGTPVTISGAGFLPGENVSVRYRTGLASPATVAVCNNAANSVGVFSCTGAIPASPTAGAVGTHKIKARGGLSKNLVSTTFTLT